jgi:hypothetical protein
MRAMGIKPPLALIPPKKGRRSGNNNNDEEKDIPISPLVDQPQGADSIMKNEATAASETTTPASDKAPVTEPGKIEVDIPAPDAVEDNGKILPLAIRVLGNSAQVQQNQVAVQLAALQHQHTAFVAEQARAAEQAKREEEDRRFMARHGWGMLKFGLGVVFVAGVKLGVDAISS